MTKNKNNGFTLIELLAVIVILALLILIAAPAVTDIMQKSAKNNFKNEVAGMVSNMENAFTSKMASSFGGASNLNDTKIHTLTIGSGNNAKTYAYLCMTLNDLVTEKFMTKNLGTSYGGYIQMFVPDTNEATITYVNITNGRYYMQGRMSDVTSDDYLPSQNPISADVKPASATTCPSSVSEVPTAHN